MPFDGGSYRCYFVTDEMHGDNVLKQKGSTVFSWGQLKIRCYPVTDEMYGDNVLKQKGSRHAF